MSEPNLKTCECRVTQRNWAYEIIKCPHCIEVEKVAREIFTSLHLGETTLYQEELIDRARACGLLEE